MDLEENYPADKFILLGKVSKAHGLKGEVKIFPFSGQPENFTGYKQLYLISKTGDVSVPLTISKCRVQKNSVIVLFESITERNQAENIEGAGVLLLRGELPEAAEDEYYWDNTVGKKVLDTKHNCIGIIINIFSNGAQDIFVVETEDKTEILIPAIKAIIKGETEKTITVDPPPGLLDINSLLPDQ